MKTPSFGKKDSLWNGGFLKTRNFNNIMKRPVFCTKLVNEESYGQPTNVNCSKGKKQVFNYYIYT